MFCTFKSSLWSCINKRVGASRFNIASLQLETGILSPEGVLKHRHNTEMFTFASLKTKH